MLVRVAHTSMLNIFVGLLLIYIIIDIHGCDLLTQWYVAQYIYTICSVFSAPSICEHTHTAL